MTSIGWDIGGVHLKAARVSGDGDIVTRMIPLALAHEGERLGPVIRDIASQLGDARAHGVTMTGELSQRFRTKADGVEFILDALEAALPGAMLRVLATDGQFISPARAREEPLLVAASNWVATAMALAPMHPDAIMIDMGSTTTDIIPIRSGAVAARGRTDPARLVTGELVYTGMLRTPADALVREVPWKGGSAQVAPDGFALVADAWLWRGVLSAAECTQPMADGGPATRDAAGDRLARLVCADRTMADDADIDRIAEAIICEQEALVSRGLGQVMEHNRDLKQAVVLGQGEEVVACMASREGLAVARLRDTWTREASIVGPAVAVAMLADAEARCGSH